MEKIPFIIKELSIQKMPGLPKGLNPYQGLSPHINIIAGPNASGKSSTARVIQQMIHRNNTDNIQARSAIQIDRENWQINIDSRYIRVQREGTDAELTGLPPAETEGRYMLAFQDLVYQEEQGLAKQILKESMGGFDLDQAMHELDYNESITTTKISEYQKYQQAYDEYNKLLNQQKALKKEEEKLQELYREKANAKKAAKLKEFYELVRDWLSQKQTFERWRKAYEDFPEVMDQLNGEEYNHIEELEQAITNTQKEIEEAQDTIDRCQTELDHIDLPKDGVDDTSLDELKKNIEQLEETGREIKNKEQEQEAAGKKEQEALKSIGFTLDYTSWKGINLEDVTNIQQFLDKAIKTYSEKQFLETEMDKLKKEHENSQEPHPDTLKKGITALSQWLNEQTSFGISGKWLWILTLTGALTAIMTLWVGWYGLFGVVLLVILTFYALQDKPANNTTTRQQDYLKTGLEPPQEWTMEQVKETLDQLSEKLGKAWYNEHLLKKTEQREEELEQLQARLSDIQKEHKAWVEKIKTAPDLPESDVKNYSGLYWFLVHAKQWQEQHAEAEALQAQKEQLNKYYHQLLKSINDGFRQTNTEEAKDVDGAKAIFNKLYKDEEKRRKNAEEIDRQNQIIQKNKQLEKDKRQKLQDLYTKLDLKEGDKERVKTLVDQLDNYKETKRNYQIHQNSLEEKAARMRKHSLYTEKQNELDMLSPDEVPEQINEYEKEASKLDNIMDQISKIEANINSAKGRNELEEALNKKEQALNMLEERYHYNLSSLTGSLLIDQLKQNTHRENQTPVFKKANTLFNRITRGRYELRVEENQEPVFKAFDTVLNVGQHLDELSTGTRLQLLLSVRLAFIDAQESTLKLPLLADELLANSDDARAKAIIDALVEISKDGRQVFYFTAQGDEVAKWKHHMDPVHDISYQVFEISGENRERLDFTDYQPSLDTFQLKQTGIPHPHNHSHEAYGKELQVPAFDLLSETIDQIHLWYLIEDPDLLYNCLTLGLKYWGQFKSFIEVNGKIEGLEADTIQKLKDKAVIMERFRELYRQGRPIPIDRSVLENSGAVSDKFIDAVSQKLEEVGKQPEKLIEALRKGEVKKFTKNKTEELEEYLYHQGYLREEEILDKNEILVHMQAMISTKEVDRAEIERMIKMVLKDNNTIPIQ